MCPGLSPMLLIQLLVCMKVHRKRAVGMSVMRIHLLRHHSFAFVKGLVDHTQLYQIVFINARHVKLCHVTLCVWVDCLIN